MITVRPWDKNDLVPISQLVADLSKFYMDDPKAPLPAWLSETLTIEAFSSRFGSEEFQGIVAEHDGKLVGYLCMKGCDYLYHLFVSEYFHHKGVARLLWEYVNQLLQGIDECVVQASIYAIPVYQRFGFEISGDVCEKEGLRYQPMTLCKTR